MGSEESKLPAVRSIAWLGLSALRLSLGGVKANLLGVSYLGAGRFVLISSGVNGGGSSHARPTSDVLRPGPPSKMRHLFSSRFT